MFSYSWRVRFLTEVPDIVGCTSVTMLCWVNRTADGSDYPLHSTISCIVSHNKTWLDKGIYMLNHC